MLIVVKIVVVSIIKTVGALIFLRFHVRRSRDLNSSRGPPLALLHPDNLYLSMLLCQWALIGFILCWCICRVDCRKEIDSKV